jgi:hypothetical protein
MLLNWVPLRLMSSSKPKTLALPVGVSTVSEVVSCSEHTDIRSVKVGEEDKQGRGRHQVSIKLGDDRLLESWVGVNVVGAF